MGNTSYSLRKMTGVRANSPLVCLSVKGKGVWYNVKLDWSLCAHLQKRGFRIFALIRCHGSMISKDFNRKVLFYMYKQYSNTFRLVKYIYDGNIQKRKVLRFFCGSV